MYSTRLNSLARDDPHLPRHQLVEHCFEQRLQYRLAFLLRRDFGIHRRQDARDGALFGEGWKRNLQKLNDRATEALTPCASFLTRKNLAHIVFEQVVKQEMYVTIQFNQSWFTDNCAA